MLIRKLFSLIVFILVFVFYCNVTGNSVEDMSANRKDTGQVLGVFEAKNNQDSQINSNILPLEERLTTPKLIEGAPEHIIQANSGLAMDYDTGEILASKKENERMTIASITKLATALIVANMEPDWDEYYRVKEEDRCEGGANLIIVGDELKLKDIFYLMLMASENNAAIALVHAVGMTEDDFVNLMNDRVKEWGLEKTIFIDPVGINDGNVSTAREVAQLAKKALDNPYIREATLTKELKVVTKNGRVKIAKNTDKLLPAYPNDNVDIRGGKTGYTVKAGYCFTGRFINSNGKEIITVILGDHGPDSRFWSTKGLVSWVYDNYTWN